MNYRVLHYFEDLTDKNHPYSVGDTFPRDGLRVSEGRLAELASTSNRRKMKLIEKITEESKEVYVYTKTQINKMSVSELRTLANKVGVNNSENLTGGVLKKRLIEHFKL